MDEKPRAYTEDEVRAMFLEHIQSMVWFWSDPKSLSSGDTMWDRCEGVAFSILAMIDGCSMDLPGFKVSPCPAPEDKDYHINEGENWFPEDIDIGGSLHDQLKKHRKPR